MHWFNVNKSLSLGIALFIVICNIILDHYYAPTGIILTPIALILSTTFVSLNKIKINPWFQMVIVYLIIALNDIGIKLYGGGIHDTEGLGWIHMFLFIGLIPCFILLALGAQANNFKDRLPLLIFIGLVWVHLQAFSDLGLGRYYKIY